MKSAPDHCCCSHCDLSCAGSSYADGAVPDSQIVAQIRALNQAYKSAGFTFQLAGTDRWAPFACSKVIRSFFCIDCHQGRSVRSITFDEMMIST